MTEETTISTEDTEATQSAMKKISEAAREDVALARKLLREGFEAGVARLTMQYNDIDARLVQIQETIESYSDDATKAMKSFLGVCNTAMVEANELVELRQAEEAVARQNVERLNIPPPAPQQSLVDAMELPSIEPPPKRFIPFGARRSKPANGAAR